jgi:hypothetical protein
LLEKSPALNTSFRNDLKGQNLIYILGVFQKKIMKAQSMSLPAVAFVSKLINSKKSKKMQNSPGFPPTRE